MQILFAIMQGDQNDKIVLLYQTKVPHVLLFSLLCVIQLPWRTAIARCCSVVKSCLTLRDPMDCSMSGFPVSHHLWCSCLENPRDGGAWWAAVCGVAQSQTQLKRLSSSRGSFIQEKWLNTGTNGEVCHVLLVLLQSPFTHFYWALKTSASQLQ